MTFQPNPGQLRARQVIARGQRHTLLYGGSRSGKTTEIVRTYCVRALAAAGSRHVIFRFRYNAARASVWLDTLPKVVRMCFPGLDVEQRRQDGYVVFPNGSELWFGGTDDKERVEKLLGMEYSSVYFNEASQIPYSSILVLRTRAAQVVPITAGGVAPGATLRQRVFYDLNPVGTQHWSYKLFVEKLDPVTRQPLPNPEDYAFVVMNPGDNADNLDPQYLRELDMLPERQRRRFFLGLYDTEIDGQLWTLDRIEAARIPERQRLPDFLRIVVAVDPSGTSGPDDKRSDEVGIVVGAVAAGDPPPVPPIGPFTQKIEIPDVRRVGYLLEDASGRYSPEGWALRVKQLFTKWKADRIIGEANYGGDMVRAVIHSVDRTLPYAAVSASRGKAVRAEPVAALYEQGLIRHAGRFPILEDQLANFSTAGYQGDRSPDRADAWIWAVHDLMLGGSESHSVPHPLSTDVDAVDWYSQSQF